MNPVDRFARDFHRSPLLRGLVYGAGIYLVVPSIIARLAALEVAKGLSTTSRSWRQIASGTLLLSAGACLDLRAKTIRPRPITDYPSDDDPIHHYPHFQHQRHDDLARLLRDDNLERAWRDLHSIASGSSADLIEVTVHREQLTRAPMDHAVRLASQIERSLSTGCKDPKLSIHFSKEPAADCGGVARDFLDELCGGLVKALQMKLVPSSGLYVPAGAVTDRKMSAYEAWGFLLMYCFKSADSGRGNFDYTYVTGTHVDASVLEAALDLSAPELDSPLEQMSPSRQLQLYQIIVQGRKDFENFQQPLRLLLRDRSNEIEAKKWISIITDEDPVGLKQPIDKLQKLMLKHFRASGIHSQLAPIQAFARGMRKVCQKRCESWDKAREIGPYVFSQKAQGAVSVDDIAEAFKVGDNEVGLKKDALERALGWLQEWIRKEAKPTEIRMMLYQITGSSGLVNSTQIKVSSKSGRRKEDLAPSMSTCDLTITLNTELIGRFYKRDFIDYFKNSVANDGRGFTRI